MISIGGVLASEPSLDSIAGLTHIAGSKDLLQAVGAIIFPQRWPVMPHSAWNRARREGRIRLLALEGVGHAGAKGYFNADHRLPDGRTALQATIALVAGEGRSLISRLDGTTPSTR